MVLLVLVTLIVVSVADGVPTVPGCCFPPQWQGLLDGITGQVQGGLPSVYNEIMFIWYDETDGRIAYDTQDFGSGPTQHTKTIYDYHKERQYFIDKNNKTCLSTTLSGPFKKLCLRDDVKPSGKFYYGLGNKTLPAIAFSLDGPDSKATVTMTADDCIPISEVNAF